MHFSSQTLRLFTLSMWVVLAFSWRADTQTLVADSFLGTSGTALTAHSPETNVPGGAWAATGTPPPVLTSSGQVGLTTGGSSYVDALIAGATPNLIMSVTWSPGSSPAGGANWGGMVFRRSDANNFFLFYYWNGSVILSRVQAGVSTNLWSGYAGSVYGSNHSFSILLSGSSIQAYWDGGTLSTAVTDAFNLTATQYGLRWASMLDAGTKYLYLGLTGSLQPTVSTVVVTPSSASIAAYGSQTYTAQARDANGNALSNVNFAWQSSNPSVAAPTPLSATTAIVSSNYTGTTTITASPTVGPSGTSALTVTPGPYIFADNFTDADGTSLTAHLPNVNQLGAPWTISGTPTVVLRNQQLGYGTGTGSVHAVVDTGAANANASVVWIPGASPSAGANYAGLVFRRTDANNYFLFEYWNGLLHLWRVQAGISTSLWSNSVTPVTAGQEHSLAVSLSSNSIQVLWDAGALGGNVTDLFNIAATQYGLILSSGDANSAYDGFAIVGTLPPVPTSVTVTPAAPSIAAYAVTTLTAQPLDALGNPLTNVSFSWTSSNPTVATVTSLSATTAQVAGSATGSATIMAVPTRGPSGSALLSVTPGPYVFADNFTGPDSTPLAAHAPNVNQAGSPWTIVGTPSVVLRGQQLAFGSGVGAVHSIVDVGAANANASVNWIPGASPSAGANYAGLVFRRTDANNYFLLYYWNGLVALTRIQAGASTMLWSAAATVSAGQLHSLSVSLSGSSIQALWDAGALGGNVTDLFNVAATQYGLILSSGDANSTYDNFAIVGSLPAVASVTMTPTSAAMAVNGNATLIASAYDASGTLLSNVNFSWQSSNVAVATATAQTATTASVVGGAVGSATITAVPSRGTATASSAISVGAGNYLVYDTFTGTDGTALTSHAPNVNQVGGSWIVNGTPAPVLHGQSAGVTLGSGYVDMTIDAGNANTAFSATWAPGLQPAGGANYGGVIFRRSDTNNFFLFNYWNGRIALFRVRAGVRTTLWTDEVDVSPGEQHSFTVFLNGPAIQVLWDSGVRSASVTDTFNIAATQYGVEFSSAWDAGATFDNFAVFGTLPPVPTTVVISPTNPSLTFGGAIANISAQGLDASGNVIPGLGFNWTTSNAGVTSLLAGTSSTIWLVPSGAGASTLTAQSNRGGPSASTTVTVNPGSYLFYDDFTDVNGTWLTVHTPNVNQTGGNWHITGTSSPILQGQQVVMANASNDVDAYVDALTPNVSVMAVWKPGSQPQGGANYGGLIFRRTDADNFFLFDYWNSHIRVSRVRAGVWTTLWTADSTVSSGETHTFSLVLAGSNIQVLWDNGVLGTNLTDTFNLVASQYGVRWKTLDAAAAFDSFSVVGTLPPAIPALTSTTTSLTLAPYDTITLAAQANDSIGNPVPGAFVQWRSSNQAVVYLDSASTTSATATAIAEGTATLTAHAPVGPAPDLSIPVTVAICIGPLTGSTATFEYTAGVGSIAVNAPTSCNWTAWSTVPWITVTAGASGNGGRIVRYSVTRNDDSTRTGAIIVGGRVFTIQQQVQPCVYTVWPQNVTFAGDGGAGSFQVFTSGGCGWFAQVGMPNSFMTTSGSGSGYGFVTYTVAPNVYAETRGGTIHIGDAIFTVTQLDNSTTGGDLTDPPPYCPVTLSELYVHSAPAGRHGSISVQTPNGCLWTVSTDAGWLHADMTGGTGSAPLNLTVDASALTDFRIGHLTVGGQVLTVVQSAQVGAMVGIGGTRRTRVGVFNEYEGGDDPSNCPPDAGGRPTFCVDIVGSPQDGDDCSIWGFPPDVNAQIEACLELGECSGAPRSSCSAIPPGPDLGTGPAITIGLVDPDPDWAEIWLGGSPAFCGPLSLELVRDDGLEVNIQPHGPEVQCVVNNVGYVVYQNWRTRLPLGHYSLAKARFETNVGIVSAQKAVSIAIGSLTVSPTSLNLSTGDTNKTITATITPNVQFQPSWTKSLVGNPNGNCIATLTVSSSSGIGTATSTVTAGTASCSGIFNVSASANGASSSNYTRVVVPPQIMIQTIKGEMGAQTGPGDNSMAFVLLVASNRFGDPLFPPAASTWQSVLGAPNQFAPDYSLTTGLQPELDVAASVFSGTQGVSIPADFKGYWSPTNTEFSSLQFLASNATTANGVTDAAWHDIGAPGLWNGSFKQAVIKSSIPNNKVSGSQLAPALVFFRKAPSGSDPAVIIIP